MKRTILNRNNMKSNDSSSQNYTQSLFNTEANYCSIEQNNNNEIQELLKELETLNSRKKYIHDRLNKLGFNIV